MDVFISIVNAAASAMIALGLVAAILSKRVLDGVVIKIGLCSMALGFVVIAIHMARVATDLQGLERALLLINSGIAVVILGYLSRYRTVGHALRRATDWADLDDKPHTTPPIDRRSA
jgi:hypothetical protein